MIFIVLSTYYPVCRLRFLNNYNFSIVNNFHCFINISRPQAAFFKQFYNFSIVNNFHRFIDISPRPRRRDELQAGARGRRGRLRLGRLGRGVVRRRRHRPRLGPALLPVPPRRQPARRRPIGRRRHRLGAAAVRSAERRHAAAVRGVAGRRAGTVRHRRSVIISQLITCCYFSLIYQLFFFNFTGCYFSLILPVVIFL